jgi:hypothetical protein
VSAVDRLASLRASIYARRQYLVNLLYSFGTCVTPPPRPRRDRHDPGVNDRGTRRRNKALKEGVFPPASLYRDLLDALAAGNEVRSIAAVQAHYTWMGDRLFSDETPEEKPR